ILRIGFRDQILRRLYGKDSYAFEKRHYAFDARGMRITTAHSESFAVWPAISQIDRAPAHIMLMLPGNVQGYVIPFRLLPSPLKPDDAVKQLRDWHARATAAKAA